VRNDDVRRLIAQAEHDGVRMGELPGLDVLVALRDGPDSDPGVAVDIGPVRVERARVVLSEQDLDGMTKPREGQSQERRSCPHAAGGAEAAQLVRDHGYAATGGHRGKRNVAFVADELLGYAGNGIGTTTTFVSLALARRGYDVQVLFAGTPPTKSVEPEWQRLYDDAGVRVRVVPGTGEAVQPSYFARSRDVEAVLQEDPPDVVVVQDLGAPAYTAIRLRSLGLAFESTSFVVFCHGTRQWVTDVSRKVRVLPGAHAVTVLERASIELADAVVSPSGYLADWMRSEGWKLPEQTYVIPHVSRAGATGHLPPNPPELRPVERLAFFGRLEERKGIRPFVAALNALDPELIEQVDVEFIGRPTPAWPLERVRELLSLRDVIFEPSLDQHEALDRLRRPGTLAVMPSFEENSPNVVYECLENGIPFIASNARGIRELVAAEDHDRVLFEPTEEGIANALRVALRSREAPRPARPAFDDAESLRRWDDVIAEPARPFPPAAPHDDAEWALLLREGDVPEPQLEETLVRAQQVSGADVVTCGLFVDGAIQLFPGEPRALGLLANGYGTVALVRRSLLKDEPTWPLFAGLSVAGARIVSVPRPLATSRPPEPTDEEARLVLRHFERAMPRNLRLLGELVPRLAAAGQQRRATRPRFVRRVARRLRALAR
jgi:glycosyltransferase involved in cell wall biosynthesis